MDNALEQRLKEIQPLLHELWPALAQCLTQAELPTLEVLGTAPSHMELRKDVYDQTHAVFMEWRSSLEAYLGHLIVHANGRCYAEFDVFCAHPSKPKWVVEAVTAWGQQGAVKTELRLLPALE